MCVLGTENTTANRTASSLPTELTTKCKDATGLTKVQQHKPSEPRPRQRREQANTCRPLPHRCWGTWTSQTLHMQKQERKNAQKRTKQRFVCFSRLGFSLQALAVLKPALWTRLAPNSDAPAPDSWGLGLKVCHHVEVLNGKQMNLKTPWQVSSLGVRDCLGFGEVMSQSQH